MPNITVNLELNSMLIDSYPQLSSGVYSLPAGSNVRYLIEMLKLGRDAKWLLVIIAGKIADNETILNDGDTVSLLPILAGG